MAASETPPAAIQTGLRPAVERKPSRGRAPPRPHRRFERAQVGGHLPGRGVPPGRVLGQGLANDLPDPGRETGAKLLHRPRLLVDDGVEQSPLALAVEGQGAGGRLVEDDAERPDVRAGVDLVALGLLGGHVGDRAHGGSRDRHPGLSGELGQAEIQDLGRPVRSDHDVARLDVAVDDAVLVGLGQALGHLGGEAQRVGRRKVAAGDPVLQGFALVAGHDDVEAAVGRFVDLVDGADVGMVEARGGPGLVDEPLAGRGLGHQPGRQELEGDAALQTEVLGLEDHAHPAAT